MVKYATICMIVVLGLFTATHDVEAHRNGHSFAQQTLYCGKSAAQQHSSSGINISITDCGFGGKKMLKSAHPEYGFFEYNKLTVTDKANDGHCTYTQYSNGGRALTLKSCGSTATYYPDRSWLYGLCITGHWWCKY